MATRPPEPDIPPLDPAEPLEPVPDDPMVRAKLRRRWRKRYAANDNQ